MLWTISLRIKIPFFHYFISFFKLLQKKLDNQIKVLCVFHYLNVFNKNIPICSRRIPFHPVLYTLTFGCKSYIEYLHFIIYLYTLVFRNKTAPSINKFWLNNKMVTRIREKNNEIIVIVSYSKLPM